MQLGDIRPGDVLGLAGSNFGQGVVVESVAIQTYGSGLSLSSTCSAKKALAIAATVTAVRRLPLSAAGASPFAADPRISRALRLASSGVSAPYRPRLTNRLGAVRPPAPGYIGR
jgi:hypothetical protein